MRFAAVTVPLCTALLISVTACQGQTLPFEDNFATGLSPHWKPVEMQPEDYRIRDGALEIRLQPAVPGKPRRLLEVRLPFTTNDSVTASVEISVLGEPLQQGEVVGLCLTSNSSPEFTVRKTNIDGYFVLAPGEPEFIGEPGEEGDPGRYTVKYWPADEKFGPLRIIVRGDYAYFQTGPATDGRFRNFFHSAIQHSDDGLGFALFAEGGTAGEERWVRFDNFSVK